MGTRRRCVLNFKGLCIVGRIAVDALPPTHATNASKWIGRMRPMLRPTRGQWITVDDQRHNAFLVFFTNPAEAWLTHHAIHCRPQCVGRNALAARRPQCGRLLTVFYSNFLFRFFTLYHNTVNTYGSCGPCLHCYGSIIQMMHTVFIRIILYLK